MEDHFTNIYEKQIWGRGNNKEYSGRSGGGSTIEYNINEYIPFLQNFITNNNIQTVIDLGCGEFEYGSLIYDKLDVLYTGYDTYKKIIDYNSKKFLLQKKYTFVCSDFYNNKEKIRNGELCILKDVLQHWKMEEIYNFLDYLVESKKFKYILIINCCHQIENDPKNDDRSTALSIEYFPLKKYNPTKLCNYKTKEISVLQLF
jgi:hypothetical protein